MPCSVLLEVAGKQARQSPEEMVRIATQMAQESDSEDEIPIRSTGATAGEPTSATSTEQEVQSGRGHDAEQQEVSTVDLTTKEEVATSATPLDKPRDSGSLGDKRDEIPSGNVGVKTALAPTGEITGVNPELRQVTAQVQGLEQCISELQTTQSELVGKLGKCVGDNTKKAMTKAMKPVMDHLAKGNQVLDKLLALFTVDNW